MEVGRGKAFATTTFDGLGRPVRTENAQGIKTTTAYDVNGRKTFESYPFTDTEKGTTIDYDGLGRVTRRTHRKVNRREKYGGQPGG